MFTHSFWKTVLWFTPWTIHWVVYETQNKPTFTNIGILIRSFSFGWLEHVGTPIISEIHIQPHFWDNWTNFVGDPAGIAPNDLFPIPRTLSEWPVLGKKTTFWMQPRLHALSLCFFLGEILDGLLKLIQHLGEQIWSGRFVSKLDQKFPNHDKLLSNLIDGTFYHPILEYDCSGTSPYWTTKPTEKKGNRESNKQLASI